MNTLEFSREAWKSANSYYNYLQDANRGRSIVNVRSIKQISDNKFNLQLSRKVAYIDSAEIKVNSDCAAFDIGENDIRIVEYNEVSSCIIVITSNRFAKVMKTISPANVVLESDLTFLVKAVREWYEKYHDKILFPTAPMIKDVPMCPENASNEQYDAIKSALTSPISYVWGAPGTGKTQMVLANCILHYTENNKQVLLMAPTNNALEQSLRGIINVLDAKNIDRDKIIRLGKATSSFLVQYPELCEVGYYDSLTDSLKQELDRLKGICQIQKRFNTFANLHKKYKELISQHSTTIKAKDEFSERTNELRQSLALIKKEIVELQKYKEVLEIDLNKYRDQLKKQEFYPVLIKNYDEYKKIISKYVSKIDKLSKELIKYKDELAEVSGRIVDINDDLLKETKILESYVRRKESFAFKFEALFSRALKSEIEHNVFEHQKKVNCINEQLVSNESLKKQILDKIRANETSIEQQNYMKLCDAAIFRISQAVFGENLSYIDLEIMFNKKISEYSDFQIDKNISKKIDSVQKKLTDVVININDKMSEMEKNKSEIHTVSILENENNAKMREIRGQISRLSIDCFGKDHLLDDLEELFSEQCAEYDGFAEIPNIEQLIKEKESDYENIMAKLKDILKERTIIACTVDYAIIHYDKFSEGLAGKAAHLFADEAAYCSLIKSGVFFSFGIPVTLLGDHMQLPPICEMDRNDILGNDQNNNLFLWDMSAIHFPDIFEEKKSYCDLLNDYVENYSPNFLNVSVSFLKKTFRFGENLASVLDRFVYMQEFCGNKDATTEIVVIHAPRSKNESQTTESHNECLAIQEYLNEVNPENFAILTPYKRQRSLIERELQLPAETVFTIHAAQGREWDTVIISVVDATWKFFMSSKNQKSNGLRIVNTAISRAKKKLVIVLDSNSWEFCKNELITEITKIGEYK